MKSVRVKFLISLIVLLLFSFIDIKTIKASGNTFNKICNIDVKETNKENAYLLYSNKYYISQPQMNYNNPVFPKIELVNKSVENLLKSLNSYGVDLEEFGKEKITYEIVNTSLKGILGHAFMKHGNPTIYMYGREYNSFSYNEVSDTVAHELGHYIDEKYLTNADRETYARMRGIDINSIYFRDSEWKNRFEEIFAEDFKTLFVDFHYFKLSTNPIEEDKKEEFRNFILDKIRTPDIPISNKYTLYKEYIKSGEFLSTEEVVLCDSYIENFLNSNLNGENIKNWTENYYKKLHEVPVNKWSFQLTDEVEELSGNLISDSEDIKVEDVEDIIEYFHFYINTYVLNKSELSYYIKRFKEQKIYKENEKINLSGSITRGEAAYLLVNALGIDVSKRSGNTGYKDVNKNHKYAKSIEELKLRKIMFGNKSGEFGLNDNITREQVSAILNRAYLYKSVESSFIKLNDESKISPLFIKDVNALLMGGIVLGNSEGLFMPKNNVSRSEYLLMLGRSEKLDDRLNTDILEELKLLDGSKILTNKEIIDLFMTN